MQELLPFRRFVCYCKYNEGEHRYRKQTAIWTNLQWTPRPMCTKATPCEDKAAFGKHIHHAQRGVAKGVDYKLKKKQAQLYSFPPALPREWADAMAPTPSY